MKFTDITLPILLLSICNVFAENNCNGTNYRCCSDDIVEYRYKDETGIWGIEYKEWCLFKYSKGTCGKAGYPCCKDVHTSSSLTKRYGGAVYSSENGQWCIIEDDYTNGAKNTVYKRCQNTTEIVSKTLNKQVELGIENDEYCVFDYEKGYKGIPYDKCEFAAKVVKTDSYGTWGEEGGKFCIMDDGYYDLAVNDCFSVKYNYRCCSSNDTKIVFKNASGESFGLEDGRVCGIRSSSTITINTTTTENETTTTINSEATSTTESETTSTTESETTTTTESEATITTNSEATTTINSETTTTTNSEASTTTDNETTLTSVPTSSGTKCIEEYGQCGGIGFSIVPLCCEQGFYCNQENDYYYQCKPIKN